MMQACHDVLMEIRSLGIKQKIYSIVALFAVLIAMLLVVSIHSVRLQAQFREDIATSAGSALYIERVNALIYAIVMESRGIYMSTDRTIVSRYADSLLKQSRELASVVTDWQKAVRADDAEQFAVLKRRINQFINFRNELVRRAIEIDPAAGREWGDNDANRSVRTALNEDLEALARIYAERSKHTEQLGAQSQLASWYLIAFGGGAFLLAGLIVFVIRNSVVTPAVGDHRGHQQDRRGQTETCNSAHQAAGRDRAARARSAELSGCGDTESRASAA